MAHAVGKDLGAGGQVMGLHGQRVGELPEQQAVALFRQFFRDLDGPLHAFGGRGQHQFRAQGMQQVAALHAHGIGHGQHAVQAPHGSHQGGIAVFELEPDRTGQICAESVQTQQRCSADALQNIGEHAVSLLKVRE